MTKLRSYVSGAWTEPADDGRPVLDAVTGEEVARVSSAGIDMAAALAYGRSAGGPVVMAPASASNCRVRLHWPASRAAARAPSPASRCPTSRTVTPGCGRARLRQRRAGEIAC